MRKKRANNFTLLEVVIAIAILAMVGGALCWRVDRLLKYRRFQTDAGRLEHLLSYARIMAINTNADWRLEIEEKEGECLAHFICLEDPEKSAFAKQISPFKGGNIFFNRKPVEKIAIDFSSTGHVAPRGILQFKWEENSKEFLLPDSFYIPK